MRPLSRQQNERELTRARPAEVSVDDFFVSELASLGPDKTVLVLPAPAVPVDAALWVFPRNHGFAFESRDGRGYAGFGVAARIEASGPGRFVAVRQAAEAHSASIRCFAGAPEEPPRWFGGFSFLPEGAEHTAWAPFASASFVWPRWAYLRDGASAWLALTVDAAAVARRRAERWHSEYRALVRGLETLEAPALGATLARGELVAGTARDKWVASVERILRSIQVGALQKVVRARRSVVRLDQTVDDRRVFARLFAENPGTTRFLFRRGDASFLGASPERLIARFGDRIAADALAGTAQAGPALLEDDKEREEHGYVIQMIRRRLGPYCRELTVSPVPELRALRLMNHLFTPIAGQLSRPTHVLELVEALHPTPAVAGWPVAEAVEFLRGDEPDPRGWYASPVGWFDLAGQGEFAVALRSGLLVGALAHVFAGAGIVGRSSPEAEYAETALKLRTFLSSLGVEP